MSAEGARRLHPASLITGILQSVRQSILAVLPIGGSFLFRDKPLVSVPIALLLLAALILFPTIKWLRLRYTIGADALVIESGVVSRQRRIIPYERVQDIDVERGLVARATGTALVRVETGGAGKDEGALDGMTLAEVDLLRAALRDWRGGAEPAMAGDLPAAATEPAEVPLFALSPARVLLAGLLGFSLVYVALIGGAIQYVEPWIEGTRFDLGDQIRNAAGDRDAWRDSARALLVAWAIGAVIGVALLFGMVTGVVLSLLRDWGFRLTETATGFRVRRGLVTIKDVQIPRRRVQRVVMKAMPLMRPFGLWRVELGTLGSADGKAGGNHVVAPLARPAELAALFERLGVEPVPAAPWRRGHGLAVLQRFVPPTGILLAIFAGFSIAFPPFLPLLLFAVPIAGVAWLAWRGERHALSGGALHVRKGVLGRRHAIVPLRRIQSVAVEAGPLERLVGLARVSVDVAGAGSAAGPTAVTGLVPEDARALAAALLAGRR